MPLPPKNSPNLPTEEPHTRMQNRKQSRVDDQGLGLSHQLGQDLFAQGLEVAPELSHPPMEGGRMKTHHPGEQVREEPGSLA
jgi:hypothetical protein